MVQAAELDRLAARVRSATRDGGLIETAQVKLVGLDEVRKAAGARWPRMREHVREGSLHIITQRIGPDDAVVPCGDGFLVVFADATGDNTTKRCTEINDALIEFYLGQDALRALRANVERDTVSAESLAGMVSGASVRERRERNDLKLGRFWPVWSGRHLGVAAYVCAPTIQTETGTRLGYSASYADKGVHTERDYLDLDLCLLEQACAASEVGGAPIGLTVHATTMQTRKSRTIYLEHLAANASPAQQRMFITIAEIEPGTPLLSLTEWVSALRHYFPRVGLDLHHSDRAIAAIASTGAWAAGYHLPTLRPNSSSQVREALSALDACCRTLRRQGVLPFVNGFQDAAFLDLASYSDVAFATGDKIWPAQPAPAGLQIATRTRQFHANQNAQPAAHAAA
jgi:hypothetical protein